MKSSALSELGRRTDEPAISWLMHAALSHPRLISLAAGFTDNESLPMADTRALLNEMMGSSPRNRSVLQYGTTQGSPALRQFTAARLKRFDGIPGNACRPDRLIITSGSQQLLYIITEALCDAGDIVLVEDPTYFVYLDIARSRGLSLRGVRISAGGIDLERLEDVLQSLKRSGELHRVKMLYLVSYFQNPTGINTAFARKAEALKTLKRYESATRHPIYLVEDAAYRELRFAGTDEKSVLAVRGFEDRVIYTGTYSKPFATGVRVGFGVLPESLFPVVMRIKGNHDFGTSNLLQQLLARALASGRYDRHVVALGRRYAHKARVMREALESDFPAEVKWDLPNGGLYFWVRLPKDIKSGTRSKLFRSALDNDVLYVPGELCYGDDPARRKPNNEMRLSFGSATERNIREGIGRLGKVLRRMIS
jgi:2-aminoadipate transaminase